MRLQLAAVAIGGAAGTLARAVVNEAFPLRPGAWPWATFVVNLAGSFVLGWVITRLARRAAPDRFRRPLLATGFCGALTTFSGLQLESLALVRDDHAALAVGYLLASVVAGLALAAGGVRLARWPAS